MITFFATLLAALAAGTLASRGDSSYPQVLVVAAAAGAVALAIGVVMGRRNRHTSQ